jgi:hypothetical protein
MISTTRTCDNCNKNLIVDSPYPAHYTLELRAVNTGINTSPTQYAVAMFPPFEGTKHFCNKECLIEYLKEN